MLQYPAYPQRAGCSSFGRTYGSTGGSSLCSDSQRSRVSTEWKNASPGRNPRSVARTVLGTLSAVMMAIMYFMCRLTLAISWPGHLISHL